MIKNFKIVIALLLLVLLFTTCKKYPERPILSFRTAINRLAGTYVMEKYIVNDIDSTDLIPPTCFVNNLEYTSADGRNYFKFDRHHNITGVDGLGGYYLSADKRKIALSFLNGPYPPTKVQGRNIIYPVKGSRGEWEIMRLTNKEFWIKETVDNLTFEVHLKKIHKL